MNAKRLEQRDITHKIETRRFWPSNGEYLNKSTLKSLSRCVSGHDLPDQFITNKTFEDSQGESRSEQAATIIGADLLESRSTNVEALIESMAQLERSEMPEEE